MIFLKYINEMSLRVALSKTEHWLKDYITVFDIIVTESVISNWTISIYYKLNEEEKDEVVN